MALGIYILVVLLLDNPDSKVHGANMGPIWARQDPGGPMLAPWTLLSGNAYIASSVYYVSLVIAKSYLKHATMQSLDVKIHPNSWKFSIMFLP